MASVYDALEQQNNACSVSGNYSSNINFITEPEDGYDFEFVNFHIQGIFHAKTVI
jgi:hypothetical protein